MVKVFWDTSVLRLFSSSVLYLTNLILTISVLTPTLSLRSSAVCSSVCLTARLSTFVLVNSCIIPLVLYEHFLETENAPIQVETSETTVHTG